ncbi:class I SAM-dependent methyltransferase [Leucobacter sp. OH2974_COT-288]|nr:class I SAM-dependent methyltransferase [Leucobacter sp. OH2974_COT-288]
MTETPLPQADRPTSTAAGHWVLARAGKRVLRPGGLKLTQQLLQRAHITAADVVEFAPGLGRTAALIIAAHPKSYRGIEKDPEAATRAARAVAPAGGTVLQAAAEASGFPSASADVVIGEAMLTMQGDKAKQEIVTEAFRLLRPGGRYAIHELALVPDEIAADRATALRQTLARVIRVNARPLTVREWCDLLTQAGFEVEGYATAPMALLQPRRNLADEGVLGVLRILRNVARDRDLRSRILEMRRVFKQHRKDLAGVAIVARVPASAAQEQKGARS